MSKRTVIMMGGKPLLSGEILRDEEKNKYYIQEDQTEIKVYVTYPISCLLGSEEIDNILKQKTLRIYASEEKVSYDVRFDEGIHDIFLVSDNGDQMSLDEAPIKLLYAKG